VSKNAFRFRRTSDDRFDALKGITGFDQRRERGFGHFRFSGTGAASSVTYRALDLNSNLAGNLVWLLFAPSLRLAG
jgi:hypothetical protein